MTCEQYIVEFIEHYKIDGLFDYQRCSGKNLHYKKILIKILRDKFRMNFMDIAKIFRNNHTTIMYHYENSPNLERNIADAWKLYRAE